MSDSHQPGRYDAIVIGGGFYGSYLAEFLKERFPRVALLEMGPDLLQRASYVNQARVHNGYHYPRSFVTALRSCVNFPRFVSQFRDCVDDSFEKVYAIARQNSKVSAFQFKRFIENIGAPIQFAPASIKRFFNDHLIEDVFLVREFAFNAAILREITRHRLDQAGVEVLFNSEAEQIEDRGAEGLQVNVKGLVRPMLARYVYNCTYARINTLLRNSGLPLLALKHEVAELALIEPPPELQQIGITVMDGPFFSAMPFPARGMHSLSHVRATPHESWQDLIGYRDGYEHIQQRPPASKYVFMIRDAQRYVPALRRARHAESLFELKTVLVQNERDDGRPILFRPDYGFKNFSVVMGSKIDNIFDVVAAMRNLEAITETLKA